MGRVDGKVVLITGAASGQGAAEAAALAAEGAQVIATDVQDPLEPPPAGVTFRRLDVGQPDDWEDTAAWLRGELGTVHGLVNNAGITWRARLDEVRLEDWDRVLRINLTSAMLGIQAITPLMTNGGSVVNISSRAGLSGHFTVAYTVAKWDCAGCRASPAWSSGRRASAATACSPATSTRRWSAPRRRRSSRRR
jgi:3alpha(or 20beta)-hydroxysteroid dehydrogenase